MRVGVEQPVNQFYMSFRNCNPIGEKIRIEEGHSSRFLSNSKHAQQQDNEQVLRKVSSIIVSLHEGYLAKCRNIEIYRDLSEEEQNLLLTVQKNSSIHTAFAGILAIDSCVKCLDKEEAFVIGNLIRAASAVVGLFKALAQQLTEGSIENDKLGDAVKYLVQQIYCLPAARGRQEEQIRQLSQLDKSLSEQQQEQNTDQYQRLLSDLHRENQLLKVVLKQKEGHISLLETKQDRVPRFQKLEEKRTTHSLAFRMSTEKSSQNGSNSASAQHLSQEITRLKQQLLQKNSIIVKMNEEFASEMEKYNSVFKRLQEENRVLKRYADLDTAFLLEELEYEIELLREEKRKDQMVIAEVQRKIQGIGMARTSRINTRATYQLPSRQFQNEYTQEQPIFDMRAPYDNRFSKFYSPTYASRLSPYSNSRAPNINIKEQLGYGYAPHDNFRLNMARKPRPIDPSFAHKSRTRLNQSREKQSKASNLYQRVMSKRM